MVVSLGADFTTDGMVTLIKARTSLPSSPALFASTDLYLLLDDAMRREVIPLVKNVKEEYWVTYTDFPVINGQTNYAIPYRAAGDALRKVVLVDPNGNEIKLTRYEPEDITFPSIPSSSGFFPLGFYLRSNEIVLFPTIASQYTTYRIRMYYERRPSVLVPVSNCTYVTSFNQSLSTVTVNSVPSTIVQGNTIDFLNNIPPFDSVADDVTITSIVGPVITISVPSTYPNFWDKLQRNFWVAKSMSSCVPQIPYEAFAFLSTIGGLAVATAIGDNNAIKVWTADVDSAKNLLNSVLTPRVEASPKILSNRNGVFDYLRNVGGLFGS